MRLELTKTPGGYLQWGYLEPQGIGFSRYFPGASAHRSLVGSSPAAPVLVRGGLARWASKCTPRLAIYVVFRVKGIPALYPSFHPALRSQGSSAAPCTLWRDVQSYRNDSSRSSDPQNSYMSP